MILTILQLSDWHVKQESEIDDVKIERMCNFVVSNTGNSNDVLIVCTGDLAYSGKEQEFDKFEVILNSIKCRLNAKNLNIVLVAGNHDCEYQPNDSIRPLVIREVLERQSYDENMVNVLTKPLDNYYAAESKFRDGCVVSCKVGSKYKFTYDGIDVAVVSINTSWMSLLTTTPGATLFPSAEDFVAEKNSGISLLLMHHTPNWFHSDQQREIRKFLLNYTFVLTGHEHEGDSYSLQKDTYRSDMIEGDEFSPFKGNTRSGFNLVSIDLVDRKFKFLNAKLNDDNYYVAEKTTQWTEIQSPIVHGLGDYELSPSFSKYLTDAGAPFTHPNAINITLDDLFIFPDLKEIARDLTVGSKGVDEIINLRSIVVGNDGQAICIVGGERSGKTTICKKIFVEKLSQKKIPVFIKGDSIRSKREEDFEALIKMAIDNQYADLTYDIFMNLPVEKKVIVIDNFHLSNLKYSEKASLLKYIEGVCHGIFVTVDEYMEFDNVLSTNETEIESQKEFVRYYILPFGYLRRNELITRWYSIGNNVYDNEFFRKIDAAESLFNTIVCKNFVPAYPFYLFTAISAFDGTSNEGLTESSYATYYSLLLLGTLKKIDRRPQEIELMLSYLSALAFKIYDLKNSKINRKNLEKFHREYCDRHQIRLDINPFFDRFIEAKLLSSYDDEIYFKYKYFYYYFLAKYLADNISKAFAQDVIINLCINLHMDTSANVVMFLTHLSKDPFVLDCIIQQADSLFSNNLPIRLDEDVSFVDELIGIAPKVRLKNETAAGFRETQLKQMDKLNGDQNDPKIYSGQDIELPSNELSDFEGPDKILLCLGATYKTLDIIGIILKNHYGSLTGEVKLSLCEQGYVLPLRALAEYFKFLSENKKEILDELTDIIKKKHPRATSSSDKDSIARRIVFELTEAISFSFVKKAAISLGSEKLFMTFESVLEKNDFHAARLIDMAIKIDCHKDFPVEDAKKLLASFKKDHIIAHCVLRDLALYKMYMYEIPHDKRQKICALFDISMARQTRQNVYALEKGVKMNK